MKRIYENFLDVLNSNMDSDIKCELLKEDIEKRLEIISESQNYTADELDKLRKRYYYLSKKNPDKLTKQQQDELKELNLYGYGSRKNIKKEQLI